MTRDTSTIERFDVTVGPLVNLWNFGPEKGREGVVPDAESIEEAMAAFGFKLLEIRASGTGRHIVRGGSYSAGAGLARSANHDANAPEYNRSI